MPRERPVIRPSGPERHLTNEDREALIKKQEKKAKLASVLERGMLHDRLHVALPEGLHGEWVPNDPLEIARKEALGFKIDTEYSIQKSLHGDGTKRSTIGDTIYMITSKENKELIDSVRSEQFDRMHNPKKAQREEQEFEKLLQSTGLPLIDEGKAESVTGKEIEDALAKGDYVSPVPADPSKMELT